MVDGDRDLRCEHALAEQPHAVPRLAGQARRQQRRRVDRLAGIEPPGIDCRLQPPEIDLVEAQRIRLGETALGQPAIDRHLTALETRLGAAGSGRLALAAAPRRLAEARTVPRPTACAHGGRLCREMLLSFMASGHLHLSHHAVRDADERPAIIPRPGVLDVTGG
jgi:hypothetical protein